MQHDVGHAPPGRPGLSQPLALIKPFKNSLQALFFSLKIIEDRHSRTIPRQQRFGNDRHYTERLATAIATARTAQIPVIYVVISFRTGHPEISARNRTFTGIADAGGFAHDDPATEIHPAVAPQSGDIVVTKRRVSAFTGSDLQVLLSGLDVRTLVLTGIATSGVVLSTLRQAADLDFELVVLADGCLDADPEVHRVLTEKIFSRQATVTTIADWKPEPSPS